VQLLRPPLNSPLLRISYPFAKEATAAAASDDHATGADNDKKGTEEAELYSSSNEVESDVAFDTHTEDDR